MDKNEAIKIVKSYYPANMQMLNEALEFLIPELKEPEDELTWLTKYIEEEAYSLSIDIRDDEDCIKLKNLQRSLAWLEKQCEQKPALPKWKYKNDNIPLLRDSIILNKYGCVAKSPSGALVDDVWVLDYDELAKLPKEEIEKQGEQKHWDSVKPVSEEDKLHLMLDEQKPTGKVKPKFHEGEWLCENELNNYARFVQILEIVNVQGKDRYRISRDIHNDEDIVEFDFVEKYYHKFDIQDAKDGDVLVSGCVIFVFNYVHGYKLNCKCSIHKDGSVITEPYDLKTIPFFSEVSPATKKQCDLLFQKMHEAGYEWDAEKKELKKIEEKSHEGIVDEINRKMFPNHYGGASVLDIHNPAWSEEDEKKLNYLIALLQNSTMTNAALSATNEGIEDFLKSLKNRVQPQPKQEWGEEDERKINRIYSILGQAADTHAFSTTCRLIGDKECIELQDFLKSLKPQTWKPSDEQIKACKEVYADILSAKGFDIGTVNSELNRLEEQLKNLK